MNLEYIQGQLREMGACDTELGKVLVERKLYYDLLVHIGNGLPKSHSTYKMIAEAVKARSL